MENKYHYAQVATKRTSFSIRNLHAQVATEFFLYMTVFIFVVIVAYVVVNNIQSAEIPSKENQVAREVGNQFVDAISISVRGGEGFTYKFPFSSIIALASTRAGGNPYNLSFHTNDNNASMIIEWPGTYGTFVYSYRLPSYTYEYAGCLCPQYNNPSQSTCNSDVAILHSNACSSNILVLTNDGKKLLLNQS